MGLGDCGAQRPIGILVEFCGIERPQRIEEFLDFERRIELVEHACFVARGELLQRGQRQTRHAIGVEQMALALAVMLGL